MIKTVVNSRSSKTAGCDITYRAGVRDVFATCPDTCSLKPANSTGTGEIDHEYLRAMRAAVPRGGIAFGYSHFDLLRYRWRTGETVINYSTDGLIDLDHALRADMLNRLHGEPRPVVVTVPENYFSDGKQWRDHDGIKIVNCPANHMRVNAMRVTCGGGVLPSGERTAACGNGRPLCARGDRDYVIAFPVHGSSKRAAADPDKPGGCYAEHHHVRRHGEATRAQAATIDTDGERLTEFARTLPRGSILRHHIVGDVGLDLGALI
jgi:hypothetical protein|tara:strand:- start:440 stop:1231 length:792 start_codon:yes stop_codon:yes gene_type:complete